MLKSTLVDQQNGAAGTNPEFRLTRPDGEEIWLRDVSGVLVDGGGGSYLQTMLVDITEAKHAEADRDRMAGELRLAQKLEAVGSLAAGIAHEINTPIHSSVTRSSSCRTPSRTCWS
jgi:signal transduction histidine kinase